jgi:transcription antitermination factor NusG
VFFRANNVLRSWETVFLTPGIFRIVGAKDGPTPIPDSEIEVFQRLVGEGVPMANSLFLSAGQRVRIRGGVLDGLEGILQSHPGDLKILVSIELIQRAVSVSLEGYDIEPA